MALQFQPPPDWLIKSHMDQPSGAQQASDSIGQALASYAQMSALKEQAALKRRQNDLLLAKEGREGRQQFYDYGDVGSLPPEVQAQIGQPAQGPMTEQGVAPQKSALISRFDEFLASNPSGIKGREKQQANRPQQVPQLIDGKPAIFDPGTGQYQIAQVVDPSAPGQPVKDPVFTPRVEPPKAFTLAGNQDGKPVLLEPKTGEMKFGTLPGAGPLMSTTQTEGQSNAKLFAQRMEESDKQLNDLSAKVDLTSVSAGAQGKAPNWMKSGNIQQFEQSKRNFLNAVLRRESGAVISPTEFDEGNKQYFPIMGDSQEVLKQKALNRRTAIEGINNAAGKATPTIGQPNIQGPNNPSNSRLPPDKAARLAQLRAKQQAGTLR